MGCWIKGLLKDCLRRSSGSHSFGKLSGGSGGFQEGRGPGGGQEVGAGR